MADQLLDVLLNLRAKFFVRTDEQAEKLAEELGDGTVLDVLTGAMRQDSRIKSPHFKQHYLNTTLSNGGQGGLVV